MRPRRLLLFGLALAGLALMGLGLVIWVTPPTNRIASVAANPDVIQEGMSQDQVESLFGVPPGDYATRDTVRVGSLDPGESDARCKTRADWFSDHASVRVYFDDRSQVVFACSVVEERVTESWWQRLRWRLGL